jgi:cytochrome c oxidase assembly protein subunit 15
MQALGITYLKAQRERSPGNQKVAKSPMVPLAERNRHVSVGVWLLICCLAIYAMVVLGGVTRLTGSGLSMVEWRPVTGILPPLSHEQWEETFSLYRQSPEFQKINRGMDLEGFKGIFWLEYLHRILGRTIGAIFLVPLLYFIIRRRIEKPLVPKLIVMFVLGGLQGLLGWYMVKSGLARDPHVSQYRLTAHLGLAFVIYAYLFWVALDLLAPISRSSGDATARGFRRLSWTVTGLVFLTVLSGGFVAGLKAGLAYNTFPLMGGQLIPDGLATLSPVWKNIFENVTTVQFDHRLLATLLFFLVTWLWLLGRKTVLSRSARLGLHLLVLALLVQITLGISTLLLVVPIPLAAAHQAGALALFTLALFVSHQMRAT